MSVTLDDLEAVNRASIRRAGARYTPALDANAPNLKIEGLVRAVDALGQSEDYRTRLRDLAARLHSAWSKTPSEIKKLFNERIATDELSVSLLTQLQTERPGLSRATLQKIKHRLTLIEKRLRVYENALYASRTDNGDDPKRREDRNTKLYEVRRLQEPISDLRAFIDAPDFALIQCNRMFLKGGWGSGKTHLLCDITEVRMRNLRPTLLLLGQTLARKIDPLLAACQVSGLAASPAKLLAELNRLGLERGCRALLIIDALNEGDRIAWRKHIDSVANRVRRYRNIALVVSCRSPFDLQVMTAQSRGRFVEVLHNGFEDIEFDAQREFFRYYQIPTPHIPLLTPEFTRPLFLKTLCETISSLSQAAKQRRINDFAAGHKGMTKLLEDFVTKIGAKIETDLGLPGKICWRLLKGSGDRANAVGIAPRMAELGLDYIPRDECLGLVTTVTGLAGDAAADFLVRMTTDGLLAEDGIYEDGAWKDTVRLPYQRFSDHLISRHLLARHLKSDTASAIRHSFYSDQPLGRILKTDRWGHMLAMPGIASAIMLEFPERVKRTLPEDERELLFYLPKAACTNPLIDAFVEGLHWRGTGSFCKQTDRIVSWVLEDNSQSRREEMLEVLVCLASRTGHPYSAKKLYGYLSRMKLTNRDLFWSEFLRSRHRSSAVYRLMDWILSGSTSGAGEDTASNLIWLCACLLTSTVKVLRDRATKCLVILGESYPQSLFNAAIVSFEFNDLYVPERMVAASFGALMRTWASPSRGLPTAAVALATQLRQKLVGSSAVAPLEHILLRDYAEGIIALAAKLAPAECENLALDNLQVSEKSVIPNADQIDPDAVKMADAAIMMDFDNYTTGRLIEGRRNYDAKHEDYQRVQRQIRWRILDLGYNPDRFKTVDNEIARDNFNQGRSDNGKKTDRYGKKYSWIAYYEVAGRRKLNGVLPQREDARTSDIDIDPSFPERCLSWCPPLPPLFTSEYRSATDWLSNGPKPDYSQLLVRDEVDGISGPWVLMEGYVKENAPNDAREISTFCRGLLIDHSDVARLETMLTETEYPGNHALPTPGEEHYTFAGEIGWSPKFAAWLRGPDGRASAQLGQAFDRTEHRRIRKRFGDLSPEEREHYLNPGIFAFIEGAEPRDAAVPSPDEFVELSVYEQVPGVTAEVPALRFGWESYHSEENDSGNPDYLAPALLEYLGLRRKGAATDLIDAAGRIATLYREFGSWQNGNQFDALYLREDLLERYLVHTRKCFVWINWGERGFHQNSIDAMRGDPEVQGLWGKHAHIHERFLMYPLSPN